MSCFKISDQVQSLCSKNFFFHTQFNTRRGQIDTPNTSVIEATVLCQQETETQTPWGCIVICRSPCLLDSTFAVTWDSAKWDPQGNFRWWFALCAATGFWSLTHNELYLPLSPATAWCKPYTEQELNCQKKTKTVCCWNKAEFTGSPKIKFQEPLAFLVNFWPARSFKYRYGWMSCTGQLKLVVD